VLPFALRWSYARKEGRAWLAPGDDKGFTVSVPTSRSAPQIARTGAAAAPKAAMRGGA